MAKFFTGMPAPAGAIVVLLPLYLHLVFNLSVSTGMIVLEAVYVLGVALLMASRIPHYSGKSLGRVPREEFIFVLFVAAAALVLLAFFPMQMLIVLSLLYMSMIPASVRAYNALAAQDAAKDAPREASVPPA
jgi:CDP-diacylglycerol--serine O-phosphatidyltransferase